ncbi:MAG TPA: ParB/RepB/Spo0J family partition protein [Spirochaetota bacterium]|nr:ParB/RepB/Spo0J family partition protein [Spirochaetota bacterium]
MIKTQPVKINEIDFQNKSYVFRHSFDVSDLENSIKYEGLLYPPILVKNNGKYIIVSGFRRLLACKNLQMTEISCNIYEKNSLQKEELLKISIAENTKRQNLRPVEIAEALLRIKEELQLTTAELAAQFGETFGIGSSKERIEKYLKLNLFDEETKNFITDSKVKNLEFALSDIDNKKDQKEVLNLVKQSNSGKIKPKQVAELINNAKKIEKNTGKKGLKQIFNEDALQKILQNNEMQGNKKLNTFLAEVENIADPEQVQKNKNYHETLKKFQAACKENGLDQKLSVRKTTWDKPSLKITMEINSLKDFTNISKFLYNTRKKYLGRLIK